MSKLIQREAISVKRSVAYLHPTPYTLTANSTERRI